MKNTMSKNWSTVLATAVIYLLSAPAYPATALPVIVEEEPNNSPDTALPFSAPVLLSGGLPTGDQDAYRWRISDANATQRWNLKLKGIPDALTGASLMRLTYSENAGVDKVSGRRNLLTFGVRDGARPAVRRNLLLPPGEIIIGLFEGGQSTGFKPPALNGAQQLGDTNQPSVPPIGSPYRLSITTGGPAGRAASTVHDTRKTAHTLRLSSGLDAITNGTTWYRFELNNTQAQSTWSITGGVTLGQSLRIALMHSERDELLAETTSDGLGHYTIPNLTLPPGVYHVRLSDTSDKVAVRNIEVRSSGKVSDTGEAEPNDTWPLATRVELSTPVTGAVDKPGELDYYRFQIADEGLAAFDLTIDSASKKSLQLCLLRNDRSQRQCRSAIPPVTLPALNLEAGSHGISVARAAETGPYTLSTASANQAARTELEPNDNAPDATLLTNKGIVKGQLDANDEDYFTLLVTGAPQLWRVQAVGPNLSDLKYHPQHGGRGQQIRASTTAKRIRMDNLYLLPGSHTFSLNARDSSKYVLRALSLGEPKPEVEREPNDTRHSAHTIPLNGKAVALLSETEDTDVFRFHIAHREHVQLSILPAADAQLNAKLAWDGGTLKSYVGSAKGVPIEQELDLRAGDYYLQVTARVPSEAEYKVGLVTALNRMSGRTGASDVEPNDSVHFANTLPSDWVIAGHVGVSRAGVDWYRLPMLSAATKITIVGPVGPRLQIVDAKRKKIADIVSDAEGNRTAVLPAKTPGYLYVYGDGDYRFQLKPEDPSLIERVPEHSRIELQLSPVPSVAAYRDAQQRVQTKLRVVNPEDVPARLRLSGTTTDPKWQVAFEQRDFTLAAGAMVDTTVTVTAAPDVWPDYPVRLLLQADDAEDNQTVITATLRAERHKALESPSVYAPLPEPLVGAINVADAAFGARWVNKADKADPLNDRITALGHYFRTSRNDTGEGQVAPTLQLAGGKPVDVVGFSFIPFGLQDGQPAQRNATRVAVSLSLDGEQFDRVLETDLSALTQPQHFTLSATHPAQFARLHLLDSLDGQLITLGEWQVLATQATAASVLPKNIAEPSVGGHIVYVEPAWPNAGYDVTLLSDKVDAQTIRVTPDMNVEFVVGFEHGRSALIDSIDWVQPMEGNSFAAVTISASIESPAGPWHPLASFDITAGDNRWRLEEPATARYLKFIPTINISERTSMKMPDKLRVIEHRAVPGRSILGQWGHNTRTGPNSKLNITAEQLKQPIKPTNTTKNKADSLLPAETRHNRVRLGHYDNWYKVTIPADHNTLALTLIGNPAVGVRPTLIDASGKFIEFTIQKRELTQHGMSARVKPGTYYIKIAEPPRSVVFTWDTSGSTAAMQPVIRQALMRYVEDIRPALDEAHMLPFGGDFLSQQWLGQPYMLQSVLNDYNGAGDSSAAETALVRATDKLRDRNGQKIIVVLTDAATNRDTKLWSTLNSVRPRIIALGVSSKGAFSSVPQKEQDLMQDWAASTGGYYEYVENVGSLSRAFDRATTKIRQPVAYSIALTTRFEDPPPPGLLQVVSGDAASGSDTQVDLPSSAVEVILDASGSMLQRLDGVRRYAIARDALTELVTNKLPAEVIFGLRVFGHREIGSCRTDLELPLAPLNRAVVQKKLATIVPKNLAKTPIADSLQAAGKDLASVDGEKSILLITDGEETCQGDVDAVLQSLRDSGLDTVVNIIGFTVDDEALIAKFRGWAAAGGGSYRQANDPNGLRSSVDALLARTFSVHSKDGKKVLESQTNAEPVTLFPGQYRVHFVRGGQVDVQIKSGTTTTVGVQ